MYETCKSATLITSFNRFGLCTSYHTAMASFTHYNGVLRSRKSNVTVTVLFQPAKPNESETTIQHGEKSFKVDLKCQELQKLCKPAKKPDLPANYQVPTDPIPVNNDLLDAVRAKGVAWLLVRLDLDADPLYIVKIRPPNQTRVRKTRFALQMKSVGNALLFYVSYHTLLPSMTLFIPQ